MSAHSPQNKDIWTKVSGVFLAILYTVAGTAYMPNIYIEWITWLHYILWKLDSSGWLHLELLTFLEGKRK